MLKNKPVKWLCVVCFGSIVCLFTACSANKIDTSAQSIQADKQKAAEKNIRIMPARERTKTLAEWESLKYGMFIHYGMSTFTGREIDSGDTPVKRYAPTQLDVGQWVRVARQAGMKYAVLTAKHVAGHCLWDSKGYDYDVAASTDKTDVVAEFMAACKAEGIKPGLYYCVLDGHNENGVDWEVGVGSEYFSLIKHHLTELHTRYPDIYEQWIDIPWKLSPKQRRELYQLIKMLNPNCLIMMNAALTDGRTIQRGSWPTDLINGERRFPPGTRHNPKMEIDAKYYYIPMEVCDTIGKHWFWKPNDPPKSANQLYEMYANSVGRGANLLLNVPPDKTGRIPDEHVKALMELKKLIDSRSLGAAQQVHREGPLETEQQRDARMQWWRQARFGLFIHWGPVSLKGTEIGWSRGGAQARSKEPMVHNVPPGTIPVEVYDNLYKQFNPVKFNADEWVQIAKDAGMKYLVFTTKHHDGFVNFNSKLTEYKITSPESPFRRDIVGELAQACHKGGLGLGFYYSQADWHHPDYRTENHARYIKYLHGQLDELCSNYGKVDVIWFDGLGGKAKDWDAGNLFKLIRRRQPNVIINNRCGIPGDFDTPEQKIGGFQTDRPWETCMTICRQWAWKPNDKMKSLKQCLQTLLRVVGGDGNFLFNVGPMPDGRIEPRQVERLREMGQWLKEYGESIYATRGGPFKPGPWGASTHKDNRIYLHILNWDSESIKLPAISKEIVAHSVLTGGTAAVKQTEEGIEISVSKEQRRDIDTIVKLHLDGPAGFGE